MRLAVSLSLVLLVCLVEYSHAKPYPSNRRTSKLNDAEEEILALLRRKFADEKKVENDKDVIEVTTAEPSAPKPLRSSLVNLLRRLEKLNTEKTSSKKGKRIVGRRPWTAGKKSAVVRIGMRVEPCGKTPSHLTSDFGIIESPGYMYDVYPSSINCHWLIEAPKGTVIELVMNYIEMEETEGCICDAVVIYDGRTESSNVLARVCSEDDSIYTTSGAVALVSFTSDESESDGGFELSWNFVGGPGGSGDGDVPFPEPGPDTGPAGPGGPAEPAVPGPGPAPAPGPGPAPGAGPGQCGRPAIPPNVVLSRIVGGTVAIPNSWPWQCFVSADLGGGEFSICGGSIIGNSYILTAAHCFFSHNEETDVYTRIQDSQYTVACGIHNREAQDLSSNAQMSQGVTVTLHENYRPEGDDWDIAIVSLPAPLTYTQAVSPVCLPSSPVADGTNCVVTGWGKKGDGSLPAELNQVVVPMINKEQCRNANPKLQYLTDNEICAGPMEGQRDSCQGDSGGPLVCKQQNGCWAQYGIVSFGVTDKCATANAPGVYANVVGFLPWIQQQTGIGPNARLGNEHNKPSVRRELNAAEKELLGLLRRKFADVKSLDTNDKDIIEVTTEAPARYIKKGAINSHVVKLNTAVKELLAFLRHKSADGKRVKA